MAFDKNGMISTLESEFASFKERIFMKNYMRQSLLLLLSSFSLTSCFQEKTTQTPTEMAQTNNVMYLQDVVTKAGNATTSFNNLIKSGNVIVDFYADWCGPCKAMSSVIGQLSSQYPHVTFLKVNVDMYPELSSSIRSIPTIIFYKNGQQVYRQSGGLNAAQMRSLIQKFF